MSNSAAPWTAARQASLSITNSRSLFNSWPLSQWCLPTISSSVIPFSSCLQPFPASGSFPVSQFFTSSGLSIGASASGSVLPMNIQGWFPLGLTGLISLQSKGLSQESSLAPQFKSINSSVFSFLYIQLHIHTWLLEKPLVWLDGPLSVMSLLFNMLSMFFIGLLPRSKHCLISWLQ